ncbi:MAG: S8/S53 family peptidase [Deltaproteobacteria bacterium]
MFSDTSPLIASLATLGLLVGCKGPAEPTATVTAAVSTTVHCSGGLCYDVADPLPASDACPDDRQIAIATGAACPPAAAAAGGFWTASNLFPGTGGTLGKYCVYEWTSTGGAPAVAALPALPHSPDCQVVSAAAAPTAAGDDALVDAFLAQVEAVDIIPVNSAAPMTKVAIVDSAVRGYISVQDGRLDHGRGMQKIIENLACPNPGAPGQLCASMIFSTLALPLYVEDGEVIRDNAGGGEFGGQSDVALAIVQAVQDMITAGGSSPMILNLSLGWDPNYGGDGAAAGFDPPIAAVYDALRYAACEGVLTFAASGNSTGGPTPSSGPAYPGGWERFGTPTSGECSGQFGITGPPLSNSTYTPLLYAVGGVDGADAFLGNARPGSRPTLLAPAERVVVADEKNGVPVVLGPYTGTSVGSAVASALAAVTWSLNPVWGPHDVAEVLFDSAVQLNEYSDFQLNYPVASRRLSMCHAVKEACLSSTTCAFVPACTMPAPYRNLIARGFDYPTSDLVVTSTAPLTDFTVGYPCDALVVSTDVNGPETPCPREQFHGTAEGPWAFPQPIGPICPVCTLFPYSAKLYITEELDHELSNPTLSLIMDDDSKVKYELDIPEDELVAGATIEVQDLQIDFDAVTKASIDFILDGDASFSDLLILDDSQ